MLEAEGPEILGALRGRDGRLAGQASKAERARALGAVRGIAWGMKAEAADRERAAREHAGQVEAQRRRDAVEVPGLSAAAWSAVQAIEVAREEGGRPGPERTEVWQRLVRQGAAVADAWSREVATKPEVAAELQAFAEAAGKRLGYGGLEKAAKPKEAARSASEGQRQREGMAGVARALSAERAGRGAHEAREQAMERLR